MSGQKFGRWLVIKRAEDHISKSGYRFTQYECKCDCGAVAVVLASALKSGRSKSCGCYGAERRAESCGSQFRTHGDSKSRLYKIYYSIKKRCYNSAALNYNSYGARGVTMCEEWRTDWTSFRDWALSNGYDDSLTIDRINVDGGYNPQNCRWVTRVAQANNRRTSKWITYQNETHTVAEWAKILDIPYKCIYKKISDGITLSEILANQ